MTFKVLCDMSIVLDLSPSIPISTVGPMAMLMAAAIVVFKLAEIVVLIEAPIEVFSATASSSSFLMPTKVLREPAIIVLDAAPM